MQRASPSNKKLSIDVKVIDEDRKPDSRIDDRRDARPSRPDDRRDTRNDSYGRPDDRRDGYRANDGRRDEPRGNSDRDWEDRNDRNRRDEDRKYDRKNDFDRDTRFKGDVWEKCAKYIRDNHKHISSLLSFFKPYEAFENRCYEEWELQEIFPDLSRDDISDI